MCQGLPGAGHILAPCMAARHAENLADRVLNSSPTCAITHTLRALTPDPLPAGEGKTIRAGTLNADRDVRVPHTSHTHPNPLPMGEGERIRAARSMRKLRALTPTLSQRERGKQSALRGRGVRVPRLTHLPKSLPHQS